MMALQGTVFPSEEGGSEDSPATPRQPEAETGRKFHITAVERSTSDLDPDGSIGVAGGSDSQVPPGLLEH